MLVQECCRETCATTGGSALCRSPWARQTRAAQNGERKGWPPFGNARVRRGMIILRGDFSCSRRTVPWRGVSNPHQERARHSQAQVVALARKLLIACGGSCERALCRTASFCVPHHERRTLKAPNSFGSVRPLVTGSPMTVRGGGARGAHGCHAERRMGPPSRSFAADAHGCIMVGFLHPPNTRLWRD